MNNNEALDYFVQSKDIKSYEYIEENHGETLIITFNSGNVLKIDSWLVSKAHGFTLSVRTET